MRLIDADKLKEHLFVGADYDKAIDDGIAKTDDAVFAFQCGWNDALKSVAEFAPTVDPMKHGHWKYDNQYHWYRACCSECGYYRVTDIKADRWNEWKYCPNCGAKMTGESDE